MQADDFKWQDPLPMYLKLIWSGGTPKLMISSGGHTFIKQADFKWLEINICGNMGAHLSKASTYVIQRGPISQHQLI